MKESFKNRVSKFWEAFADEERLIREMMDNKVAGETLLNFVDSILQIAFNKVYFEMGINTEGKYELILTPEGDRCRLIQLHYWLQYAPKYLREKWNFYSTKPAHGKSGSSLCMFDLKIGEKDIIIYPEVESDKSKINIKIYSPKLMSLKENKRYSMFFIYMDQFIGELYSMEYIGDIDFIKRKQNKASIKITELKSLIDNSIENHDWAKFDNPCEIYSGYRMNPSKKKGWGLREDILSGYTSCSAILNEYYNGEKFRFEEAKEDGVYFGFLFFENTSISDENIINFRGEIEDKILNQTVPYGIAHSVGGATGSHFSYIDFIIYDYKKFIPIAEQALAKYPFDEMGYSNFVKNEKLLTFLANG